MKNTFKFSLIMSLILFMSCNEDSEDGNIQDQATYVTAPDNMISIADAQTMHTTYQTERARFLEQNLQKKPTTVPYIATESIRFDYKKLKQYLAYIEQESEKAGITIESLGVYFSKYPDNGKLPSKTVKNRDIGGETVFFNPLTTFEGSNYQTSYVIKQSTDGDSEAVPVGDIITYMVSQKSSNNDQLIDPKNIKSLAANQGHRRPPPKSGENDYGSDD